MTAAGKAWVTYVLIVASLMLVAYVLLAIGPRARQRRARADDTQQRLDRICLSVQTPLRLARDRIRTTGSVEAGRDIAFVIAPVVAQCTGLAAHRERLEALTTSTDARRDVEVIQGIIDEMERRP